MSTRRKAKDEDKWIILSSEKRKNVEIRLLAAAETHRLVSFLCADTPNSNRFYIPFFNVVSFQLTLVSVEQSLRLLFVVLFSLFPKKPNHNLHSTYKALQEKSAGEEGLCKEIIRRLNDCAKRENMSLISEEEISEEVLVACLEKHRSSYLNTKYFQVDTKGELYEGIEVHGRGREILYSFALALVALDKYEIAKRDYKTLLGHSPEPEMTEEELVAFMEKMGSFHSAIT